jgi:beta-N-acetylhexosaminidase
MKKIIVLPLMFMGLFAIGQHHSGLPAKQWVDSVFKQLSKDQKIAQLMVVRLSTIDASTKKIVFLDAQVEAAIRQYNIGGICLFQGGPVVQANMVNRLQSIASTPLLVCIDAENGLGMRMDSVLPLPRQMTLGAIQDPSIIYQYGKWVGQQCRRAGIQVNYAPVVDINNNPNNPIINDRSFGEDKYKVAALSIQYMKGMQDTGVMACAKHFPGHGDVTVDSHKDLPIITKTRAQLDSLELYPFKAIFKAGVGSVMIAHLSIPAIDNTPNLATSLSYKNVTVLMRKELGYNGLTFTDGLEMQGVTKFFPDGEVAAQSLIAGNDMLCLPNNIPSSIKKIKEAIQQKKLSWNDIDTHVKKVLYAKYQYGLANLNPISTSHITEEINSQTPAMKKLVAENAITLLYNADASAFPLKPSPALRVAYVAVGTKTDNTFAKRLREDYHAAVFYFDYKANETKANALLTLLKDDYDVVITGLHSYARYPANNFGISKTAITLIQQIQQQFKNNTFIFGNPYAIKNFCSSKNLVVAYEDDEAMQTAAADLLLGRFAAKGKLPVTVCEKFSFGAGITTTTRVLPSASPETVGLHTPTLQTIDNTVTDGIKKKHSLGR